MGWNGGGDIFDGVARGLIEARATDDVKYRVLSDLVKALQQGDWDTEDESLEQFQDDPIIRKVFRDAGVGGGPPEDSEEFYRRFLKALEVEVSPDFYEFGELQERERLARIARDVYRGVY